jgi:excisionase family DNA binding protein
MWSVTVLSYTHRTAKESPSVRVGVNRWQTEAMPARFLQMSDVAEELSVTLSQVYHMVRSGELPAIKVGGRGQWRIERAKLEEYIERKYGETARWVQENPLIGRDGEPEEDTT